MAGVDWKGVKVIRGVLVHDDDGVEVEVTNAIATELPGLLQVVEMLLADAEG